IRTGLVACLVHVSQAGLAQDSSQISEVPSRSWATAPRHSAGIAPNPVQLVDLAIVQVYAAPTYGWGEATLRCIPGSSTSAEARRPTPVTTWSAGVLPRCCSATTPCLTDSGTERPLSFWWTTGEKTLNP